MPPGVVTTTGATPGVPCGARVFISEDERTVKEPAA
jgi:hypothetical protein